MRTYLSSTHATARMLTRIPMREQTKLLATLRYLLAARAYGGISDARRRRRRRGAPAPAETRRDRPGGRATRARSPGEQPRQVDCRDTRSQRDAAPPVAYGLTPVGC